MGLTENEFAQICQLLGREPSLVELGMFSVMWSEHCGYKYSRPVLAYFKRYKESLEGEGFENAGIVDIGDGLGITMKIESHNHPSAVEPYQGAATGVGGIIRDILTMGARPIALLDSLRFGPIEEGKASDSTLQRNRYLYDRVVAGIGGYGNCVGVPTVAGEVAFDERYSGNPLVNAMCVGVLELDKVATAAARGIDNPVIYLGSSTGKDGIQGASFASEALGDDNQAKRPNVQIGDPFAEKLLIEATLEALQTGAIVAIQDMGAAGLTCGTVEMASKGGVGMEIDLDLVPTREAGMSAFEMMLSESQERMLCVAEKGREHEVVQVFHKWGLPAVVIGRVTSDGLVRVKHHGAVEVEAPAKLFTDECPTYQTEVEVPDYYKKAQEFDLSQVPVVDPNQALRQLLECSNLASKEWVYRQYDTQVQTQTVVAPGDGDAAVIAVRGSQKGLALKVDGNGRWVYFDPYVGGQLAVAEAARNVACVGAKPVAITDGLNFGKPQKPHVYWQFREAVRGIADAAEVMGTPVISGNVSFYNESDLGEVLPTPLIGMLGLLEDAHKHLGMILPAESMDVSLISYELAEIRHEGLGASEYLKVIHELQDGRPTPPDLHKEKALCDCLVELAAQELVIVAHDVSEGGIAVALCEMCLHSKVGAAVHLDQGFGYATRSDSALFGELPGRVILAHPAENFSTIKSIATQWGLHLTQIGSASNEHQNIKIALRGVATVELTAQKMTKRK